MTELDSIESFRVASRSARRQSVRACTDIRCKIRPRLEQDPRHSTLWAHPRPSHAVRPEATKPKGEARAQPGNRRGERRFPPTEACADLNTTSYVFFFPRFGKWRRYCRGANPIRKSERYAKGKVPGARDALRDNQRCRSSVVGKGLKHWNEILPHRSRRFVPSVHN
jgi:hypothetical protein